MTALSNQDLAVTTKGGFGVFDELLDVTQFLKSIQKGCVLPLPFVTLWALFRLVTQFRRFQQGGRRQGDSAIQRCKLSV